MPMTSTSWGVSDGEPNASIARRLRFSPLTVGKWRKRYLKQGLAGLHDELRSGRSRSHEKDRHTCQGPPFLRSRKISRAALRPGMPLTPPPGCAPAPQ